MNRYIDLNKLGIGYANRNVFENKDYVDGWNSAIDIISKAPTADVVEVVRCKDCEIAIEDFMCDGWYYCNNNRMTHSPSHFCGYGRKKRKE